MLRHGIRLLVAILTFTIGIAVVWALQLIPRLETALVDRLFPIDDLGPISRPIFDSDKDANEVYRLLLHQKFTFDGGVKLTVLQSETTGCPMYEDEALRKEFGHLEVFRQTIRELMPEAESQTLDDYSLKNKTSEPLRVSNLGINYVIVRTADLPDTLEGFWTTFYTKYPNSSGLVFFSKVGFNDQHDQAFVYAGRSCGGLCGMGEYVLLQKVNGRWKIRQERVLWVS